MNLLLKTFIKVISPFREEPLITICWACWRDSCIAWKVELDDLLGPLQLGISGFYASLSKYPWMNSTKFHSLTNGTMALQMLLLKLSCLATSVLTLFSQSNSLFTAHIKMRTWVIRNILERLKRMIMLTVDMRQNSRSISTFP